MAVPAASRRHLLQVGPAPAPGPYASQVLEPSSAVPLMRPPPAASGACASPCAKLQHGGTGKVLRCISG